LYITSVKLKCFTESVMNLEKNNLICELFGIYGNLLTDHQKIIFENYYFKNFSLAEIAENEKISRQAVKDVIDKCENYLFSFEEKLQIKSKNDKILSDLGEKLSEVEIEKIKEIIYKRK